MDNALERIYKSGLKFLVPLTPEETFRIIVDEAIKLVHGDQGAIFLEEGGALNEIYSSVPGHPIRVRRKGFTHRSFAKRETFIVNAKELSKIYPQLVVAGIKSIIFIPLSYKNKSIGVLTVRSDKNKGFAKNEPDILRLFGSMASLAIRKMQLYDEVKRALEIKDLFLSMAAHEFRTPLTTISGYTQLLVGKLPKDHSAQSRWVEELSWETDRLTSLVNELLEVSRIKGGQFQYVWRECHLIRIMERAVAEFCFSHPDRELHFYNKLTDSQDIVVGDFDKLIQVASNLLDNAAKFSSAEKEVSITLDCRPSDFVITVKDSGQGIEKKDLPRIFEGFYRGSRVPGEGMGIGLFLAKSIVTRHKGLINVRSKPGKGTSVEVRLPRAKR